MKRSISYSPGLCFHRWRTVLTLLAIMGLVTGTIGIADMLGISDMPLALASKPKVAAETAAAGASALRHLCCRPHPVRRRS